MNNRCAFSHRTFPILGMLCAVLLVISFGSGIVLAQTEAENQGKEMPPLPPLPELPLSPTERAVKDGSALRLSLKEVTKLALQSAMGVESASKVSAFRAFRTRLRDVFLSVLAHE